MIGLRTIWRGWFVAAVGIVASLTSQAAGNEPAHIDADEIKALERRLTDAGCYKGAIDGKNRPAFNAAVEACPDQQPVLRIETELPTRMVSHIGVDAACSLLATSSYDQAVRLWSLPDGTLIRVSRLPLDGEPIALSPDRHWLAFPEYVKSGSGTIFLSVTLLDLARGSTRRLGIFPGTIERLTFSSNGARLAIGWPYGVRVLDSTTGALIMEDREYDNVRGLTFGPEGELIASSLTAPLRRYDSNLKLTAKRALPDGASAEAIDRSGHRVAVVGYKKKSQSWQISILDAKTLAPLAEVQTENFVVGEDSPIAWSKDGTTLIAGGSIETGPQHERSYVLRRFDAAGRRQGDDAFVSDTEISDVAPCGDGFAFAAEDPTLGLISAQGTLLFVKHRAGADMRDKLGLAFMIAPDALSVRFGLGRGSERPVLFDLLAASLTHSPSPPNGFLEAKVEGLLVKGWQEGVPRFKGEEIAGERVHALAIRPDASGFALGGEHSVSMYDASGPQLWSRGALGETWAVNFSADGQILVTASEDGIIRWLRGRDGEELLSLFVVPETRKWIVWTQSGYYMSSAGGEDLIGWQINRGWSQEADFFTSSQFRAEYNRPDIVKLVLETKDEADAIRRANAAAQRAAPRKSIAAGLPPVVTIESPQDGSSFSSDSIEIGYSLRSPSGLSIDRLDVLVDGQPVDASGFKPTAAVETQGHITLAKPAAAKAKVSLIAHSSALLSAPSSVSLAFSEPPLHVTRNLYALLVGVTAYTDKDHVPDLKYANRDAESLAEALRRQKGGLYGDVQTRILDMPADTQQNPDRAGPPTRDQVIEGLEWLKKNASEFDLTVVYLSGHGYSTPNGKFWFLTQDAETESLETSAVSGDEVLNRLRDLKGKKLLFLDACHAGAALASGGGNKVVPVETRSNMDQLTNAFTVSNAGIVAYAAAEAQEIAFEGEEYDRHGAFAQALSEALGKGRGADPNGELTTDLLDHYLATRVVELTKDHQHPVANRPQLVPDFPVALARP